MWSKLVVGMIVSQLYGTRSRSCTIFSIRMLMRRGTDEETSFVVLFRTSLPTGYLRVQASHALTNINPESKLIVMA